MRVMTLRKRLEEVRREPFRDAWVSGTANDLRAVFRMMQSDHQLGQLAGF